MALISVPIVPNGKVGVEGGVKIRYKKLVGKGGVKKDEEKGRKKTRISPEKFFAFYYLLYSRS